MSLNMVDLEELLEKEIGPDELAESIDDIIFNLINNHLEVQGEPLHKQLQKQVYNLRRLRDTFSHIKED